MTRLAENLSSLLRVGRKFAWSFSEERTLVMRSHPHVLEGAELVVRLFEALLILAHIKTTHHISS